MVSSLGFGSSAKNLNCALLTLAFTKSPSQKDLDKLSTDSRWLVLQKARRHPDKSELRLFVSEMVSGSISPGSTPYFSPFPHGTGSLLVRLSI